MLCPVSAIWQNDASPMHIRTVQLTGTARLASSMQYQCRHAKSLTAYQE